MDPPQQHMMSQARLADGGAAETASVVAVATGLVEAVAAAAGDVRAADHGDLFERGAELARAGEGGDGGQGEL